MTRSGAGSQPPLSGRPRLRRLLGGVLLVLAALVLVLATLFTYTLTKEYGFSPNDGPAHDLSRAAIGNALVAMLVTMLLAGGLALTTRLRGSRRLVWLVAAFLAAFVLLGLGMALGQWALDARCAGPDRFSTGAC